MEERRAKQLALAATIIAAAVVVHPALWNLHLRQREGRVDSFPLSTYPMFARRVPEVSRVNHVEARTADGALVRVPYWYWGRGGMNQARGQLNRAVNDKRRGSPERLDKLCDRAAKSVARRAARGKTPWKDVVRIEVVRTSLDADHYFSELDGEPGEARWRSRRVRKRCEVEIEGGGEVDEDREPKS